MGRSPSSSRVPRNWAMTSHPFLCITGNVGTEEPGFAVRFIWGVPGLPKPARSAVERNFLMLMNKK